MLRSRKWPLPPVGDEITWLMCQTLPQSSPPYTLTLGFREANGVRSANNGFELFSSLGCAVVGLRLNRVAPQWGCTVMEVEKYRRLRHNIKQYIYYRAGRCASYNWCGKLYLFNYFPKWFTNRCAAHLLVPRLLNIRNIVRIWNNFVILFFIYCNSSKTVSLLCLHIFK